MQVYPKHYLSEENEEDDFEKGPLEPIEEELEDAIISIGEEIREKNKENRRRSNN